MSTSLGFLPVVGSAGSTSPSRSAPAPIRVPAEDASRPALALVADPRGNLTVRPACEASELPGTMLGEIRSRPSPSAAAWWLASRSRHLTVNGLVPLALSVLSPGDLLAFGDHWWLTVTEWKAETTAAPAEMAEKPCPVCGMPLNLAAVVQCPCGRFYHLENAEAADPGEVLNCFLAGPCRMCNRSPSLGPVLMPVPPAKLLGTPAAAEV